MKIGYFKKGLFINCDKMLSFVNFKNGGWWGTCVHQHTLSVILRVLSNRLMCKLIDTSACLGMQIEPQDCFGFPRKLIKSKWLVRTFC